MEHWILNSNVSTCTWCDKNVQRVWSISCKKTGKVARKNDRPIYSQTTRSLSFPWYWVVSKYLFRSRIWIKTLRHFLVEIMHKLWNFNCSCRFLLGSPALSDMCRIGQSSRAIGPSCVAILALDLFLGHYPASLSSNVLIASRSAITDMLDSCNNCSRAQLIDVYENRSGIKHKPHYIVRKSNDTQTDSWYFNRREQ